LFTAIDRDDLRSASGLEYQDGYVPKATCDGSSDWSTTLLRALDQRDESDESFH
jgi:hypothetical protein